jgi:hypothetical protein
MKRLGQRYSRVEESLTNDPEFIKVVFHIGKFIIAAVDTEAERVNTDALYADLESASVRFNIRIFHLTFCIYSCLVLTSLFHIENSGALSFKRSIPESRNKKTH